MKATSAIAAIAIALLGSGTAYAVTMPTLYEEALAHKEEAHIIAQPIAGIANKYWFDYQVGVVEAKKELASDLHRADDTGDLRDAWGEYAHELRHERRHYIKKMAKRGYRVGEVYLDR